MRSFKVFVSAAFFTVSGPAFAGDLNTYRTGNAYLKVPAPGAQSCEAQCNGDAQCKGWNFLRSGAPNGSGICEFNSQISGLSAHPYAISGLASSSSYAGGTLVQGATRTTRIGQPVTIRPQIRPQLQQASTRPMQRQIRRAPAPVTRTRQFIPQQTAPVSRPILQRSDLRKPATLGGPLSQVRPTTPPKSQVKVPQRPHDPDKPRIYGERIPTPNAERRHTPAPTPHNQQAKAPKPPRSMQARRPQAPMAYQDAVTQTNLYGSLYDNVKTSPAAPKVKNPLYNERPAEDPDAPIATSQAVPTAKVSEDSLAMAGPAPR